MSLPPFLIYNIYDKLISLSYFIIFLKYSVLQDEPVMVSFPNHQ